MIDGVTRLSRLERSWLAIGRLERAWLAIGVITLVRVVGLVLSPVELHGDEAQYWSWSRTLDFGYFSKPPLVAWAAALTTGIFGQQEWAIRLGSPLAHAGAALFLMAAARRRWGDEVAMWTGLLYITMPAVWLSSGIISTDAYLMLMWSGALWAYVRLLDRPTLARGIALGLFIGVGFLAKYAMIYFVIGVAALIALHRPSRRALLSKAGPAALATTALCILPNLLWNASHRFETISHTVANANWEEEKFHPGELLTFLADQLGVFGPITFVLLIWAFIGVARATPEARERWLPLLALTAPALLIVSAQAFINSANANWGVGAYCAGTILVAAWAVERGWVRLRLPRLRERKLRVSRLVAASVALHLSIGMLFAAAALSPPFADQIGLANAFKRTRGWQETADLVRGAYERGDAGEPFAVVLVDNRLLFHELEYYGREDPLPLRMWLRWGAPQSHAEERRPMTAVDGPALVVSERRHEEAKIRADFQSSTPARELVIDLGGGKQRRLLVFAARGFSPRQRGPEYEARWTEQ